MSEKKKLGLPITAVSFAGLAWVFVLMGFLAKIVDSGRLFSFGVVMPPIFGIVAFILGLIGLVSNKAKSKIRMRLSIAALLGAILVVPLMMAMWNFLTS